MTKPANSIRGLRQRLTREVTLWGQGAEAHPLLGLTVLLAIWLLASLKLSLSRALWHDELFTYFIAQAPTLREAFHQTRTVDLNPPLSYLLTRVSFALFGVGTLQTRLPEMLGYSAALIGIFLFVRRRLGNAFGLFAAALLLAGETADLCIQARPYGLMLGFIMLSLVAWQASAYPSSAASGQQANFRRADFLLATALLCLLLTHIFGLLAWAVIVVAELTLSVQRRRVSIGRVFALLLPLVATVLYMPMLRSHGASVFPQAFQPSGDDIFKFYIAHIDCELVSIWLAALVIVLIVGRVWLRGSTQFRLALPEWVAAIGITSLPIVLIVRLMLQHAAFFARYGAAGSLGICIVFSTLYCWWTDARPAAAVIAILLALLITSRIPDAISAVAAGDIFFRTEPLVATFPLTEIPDAALPLVDASGLSFVEMNHREPAALLDRTFYLTGGDDAIRYAHATIFEGMAQEAALFHFRAHTQTYLAFIQQHTHFYVFGDYDYPEDWLLRKLHDDGATIRRISTVRASYLAHELYEVTIPAQTVTP